MGSPGLLSESRLHWLPSLANLGSGSSTLDSLPPGDMAVRVCLALGQWEEHFLESTSVWGLPGSSRMSAGLGTTWSEGGPEKQTVE